MYSKSMWICRGIIIIEWDKLKWNEMNNTSSLPRLWKMNLQVALTRSSHCEWHYQTATRSSSQHQKLYTWKCIICTSWCHRSQTHEDQLMSLRGRGPCGAPHSGGGPCGAPHSGHWTRNPAKLEKKYDFKFNEDRVFSSGREENDCGDLSLKTKSVTVK